VADRRRQKAYERAQKHGRAPSPEQLAWCDWTLLMTNCPTELLTWKEVVVLYRARWQIETGQADSTSSDRWCEAPGAGYHRRRRAA
jgi:hypothetical protein